MTLILSHLSRAFVLQVSDRLVMKEVRGTPSQFDALANKSIVYWARDAIVCIAYTGAAYIGQLPTDDWIVQKLTGVDVSEKFGIRGFPLSHWLDIGQSLRLLLQELASSEVAQKRTPNFELTAVGWQWKTTKHPLQGRYQPVPMAWELTTPPDGQFATEVEHLPRYWYLKHRTFFHASSTSNLPKAERDKMFERLRNDAPSRTAEEAADKFEQAMVHAIRSIAASNPYVGPNCMSVLLARPISVR